MAVFYRPLGAPTIELGKYSPSLEVAFRIAAVFGKPLEDVFECAPDG